MALRGTGNVAGDADKVVPQNVTTAKRATAVAAEPRPEDLSGTVQTIWAKTMLELNIGCPAMPRALAWANAVKIVVLYFLYQNAKASNRWSALGYLHKQAPPHA